MFSLSLNIFILHRLRNDFLQLILISLHSASRELHQYSRRMCGPMKNPKVETRSRDSNSEHQDCEADALPHDHEHHQEHHHEHHHEHHEHHHEHHEHHHEHHTNVQVSNYRHVEKGVIQ